MRAFLSIPLFAVIATATGAGALTGSAAARSAWTVPEALVSTPEKARAAGDYWTFDRMDLATPRLPDLLDPVTLEPVSL